LDLPAAPPGPHHRSLQHRWWPLPDLSPAPPWGSVTDVFNFSDGRCRTCRQHPPGGRHRRLQLLDLQLRHLPGAHRQCFLALMVDAPRPPAPAPPRVHRRLPSKMFKITERSAEELAPPVGSQPLPTWARGASVGTLKTRYPHIQALSRQGAGRASTRCHVRCSFRPHLPAEVGSRATICPAASDLTSFLR
jgi:hypothetical protein